MLKSAASFFYFIDGAKREFILTHTQLKQTFEIMDYNKTYKRYLRISFAIRKELTHSGLQVERYNNTLIGDISYVTPLSVPSYVLKIVPHDQHAKT